MSTKKTTRFITNKMCPFAQKVWIALECAGVDYKMEQVSLYGANGKPSWFLQLNPAGTVPVLVVECTTTNSAAAVFPDSDLILNQFEKEHDTSTATTTTIPYKIFIGASSPEEQAKIKEWRSRINQMLPVGKQAVLSSSSSKSSLKQVLKEMNQAVVGPYLVGDRFTTADCHALPFLWRLQQEFGYLQEYDNLHQWLETCQQRPEVKKTLVSSWWWWW